MSVVYLIDNYIYVASCVHTVDMEKITELNFRGFNPTEVFTDILLQFLTQKCLLLKSDAYIHGKTFVVLLKTTKTVRV